MSLATIATGETPGGAAPEPRDHVLFVGSDFTVLQDGDPYPVVGAGDRTFIVKMDKKTAEYPLKKLKHIQISRGLKLSNLTARLDNFDASVSSDGAAADLAEATQNAMALAVVASIQMDHLQGMMVQADFDRGVSGSSESPIRGASKTAAIGDQAVQDAFSTFVNNLPHFDQQTAFAQDMAIEAGSAMANLGEGVELVPEVSTGRVRLSATGAQPLSPRAVPGGPAPGSPAQRDDERVRKAMRHIENRGGTRVDRFDLEFTVAAPEPLDSAYVVLVTEYSTPKEPNEAYRRVLTKYIGHIDSTPRKVSLYQTDYPEGFHLRTYTIDIYANGREIATNVSETKMRMTRDEAYEYLLVDYLTSHKGQTLPPAAILLAPRTELVRSAGAADLTTPVYVSVNEKGEVTAVSTSARHVSPPSGGMSAALQRFRFIPALDKGIPVNGRARLVMAEFAQ